MSPERRAQFKGQFDPLPFSEATWPSRIGGQQQAERIKRLNTASWEQTVGTIELRTHNRPRLYSLFENNRALLANYYRMIYTSQVSGEELSKEQTRFFFFGKEDPRSKIFAPHFRIIRETVTGNIEKRTKRSEKSKGLRKHIREEKAQTRRNSPLNNS